LPRPWDPAHPEVAIDFWDLPWPSELWKRDDGRLDLDTFPGRDSFLLHTAVDEAARDLRGFSLEPAVCFRLSGPIDPGRLPSARSSIQPGSPIVLLDVDPASPERGRRVPIEQRYYDSALTYVPAQSLILKTVGGVVLRPGTLYAAAVLRTLGSPPLGTSADLERTKSTEPQADPVLERARLLHRPALEELERQHISRAELAALAVFRTADALAGTLALFDEATNLPAAYAPKLLRAEWLDKGAAADAPYSVIRGYYCTPSFQTELDAAPFEARGGLISYDEQGRTRLAPIAQDSRYWTTECGESLRARFVLTVPRTAMPQAGWPLIVSAHGTTGDAFSFVGRNDLAGWAAAEGFAAVSTDQPLHGGRDPEGARPGSREPFTYRIAGIPVRLSVQGYGAELAFYHPLRPAVMRDNLRQATVDMLLLSRLVSATDFSTALRTDGTLVLAASEAQQAPRFDRSKLMLFGHSQGSQSAMVAGAIDPLVHAVVLSGCSGDFRLEFVERRDSNALAIIEAILGLAPTEIDRFHPVLSLAQTVLDPVDPQVWARAYSVPLPGRLPRSLLHIQGLGDTMAVPAAAEALGLSLGATPLTPVVAAIPGIELFALSPAPSVSGNAAAGAATLAWLRLAPQPGNDGHFVLYDVPAGSRLLRQMLREQILGHVPPTLGPVDAASPGG